MPAKKSRMLEGLPELAFLMLKLWDYDRLPPLEISIPRHLKEESGTDKNNVSVCTCDGDPSSTYSCIPGDAWLSKHKLDCALT